MTTRVKAKFLTEAFVDCPFCGMLWTCDDWDQNDTVIICEGCGKDFMVVD